MSDRAHYLRRYIAEAPLATALWRSSEAAALATVELPRPLLDIGCGFGEFARIFFEGRHGPDVGIDIDAGELRRAHGTSPYRTLIQCDARRLPFASASFAGAISVSTLEHIPDVPAALRELHRALRPGGVAAITVPTRSLSTNLLGHRGAGVAWRGGAEAYARAVNRWLTHVNVWPADEWERAMRDAGFVVERAQPHVSPRATIAFEALLPAALASRLWRQAFGRRPPRPAWALSAAERALRPLVDGASAGGSNLLIVARRPAP